MSLESSYCINSETQQIQGNGMPIGGIYSGPGVVDNGDGKTYMFNPASAGVGIHTITYTVSMMSTQVYMIEVLAVPILNTINDITGCNCDQIIFNIGTSNGIAGTYDLTSSNSDIGLNNMNGALGTNVEFKATNNTINPIMSTITITPTDLNGCIGSPMSFDIIVDPTPNVEIRLETICSNKTLYLEEIAEHVHLNNITWSWSSNGSAEITNPNARRTIATCVSEGEIFTMTVTQKLNISCSNSASIEAPTKQN